MRHLFVLAALLFALPASAVTIDWVTVGDPGNPGELSGVGAGGIGPDAIVGGVDYTYKIGKYQVTYAQYAEFLNAVAATDTYFLYNLEMGPAYGGGIARSGTSGNYTYSAIAGRGDRPVNFVTFFMALRFANWLNNGQGTASTETGAYTLLGGTPIPSNWLTVTRNVDAIIFLPSEDEWYKAAYYDAGSLGYNPYPFADGFNGAVCEVPPGTTSHSANCHPAVGDLTDVGSYTSSPSEYGTFDQGGNVLEWNETRIHTWGRVVRGGCFICGADASAASRRYIGSVVSLFEADNQGFRVAMIPEPSTGLLLATGLAGLAATGRRRDRGYRCRNEESPRNRIVPGAQLVAGERYARVFLPVPLVLPVLGNVTLRAA